MDLGHPVSTTTLKDNSNSYPINMIINQDIALSCLIMKPGSIKMDSPVKKLRKWKRVAKVRPVKSENKQKMCPSPFKHTRRSAPANSISDSAKQKLVIDSNVVPLETKRSRCTDVVSSTADRNASASPGYQN
ncbi:hypothetical protein PanWU01x14_020410, partial [Parasponia andersonii]